MAPDDRGQHAERIVQAAVDEVGETIAFLEDMPLRRGVNRLRTMCDDLERLARSCRLWSREPVSRPVAHAGPGGETGRISGYDPATRDNGPAGPKEGAADGDHGPAAANLDLDRAASRLIHNQTRRVERLSRQVRAEWQEKLLALRMETLFGRRFVAILENDRARLDPRPFRVDRG